MDPNTLMQKATAVQRAEQELTRLKEQRSRMYRELFNLDKDISAATEVLQLARMELMQTIRTTEQA